VILSIYVTDPCASNASILLSLSLNPTTMQNPTLEIPSIITALTSAPSSHLPLTFQKYFLSDAGFRHPLCRVDRGEGSREKVAGVYEWYRVISPLNGANILSVGKFFAF
jgi:hypothetical protein